MHPVCEASGTPCLEFSDWIKKKQKISPCYFWDPMFFFVSEAAAHSCRVNGFASLYFVLFYSINFHILECEEPVATPDTR